MTKNYQSKSPLFLLPNEKIVFKSNPHWLFLAIPILGIFLFFFFYLFFACPYLGIFYQGLEGFCYAVSLFILLFLSIIFYLDWRFNRLWLTNFRLIKERGIIGKRFMAIRLSNIENITCSYGIWGRIFRFGDLAIESAGTYGKMLFKGLPRPRKIKLTIEKQMFYSNLELPLLKRTLNSPLHKFYILSRRHHFQAFMRMIFVIIFKPQGKLLHNRYGVR